MATGNLVSVLLAYFVFLSSMNFNIHTNISNTGINCAGFSFMSLCLGFGLGWYCLVNP